MSDDLAAFLNARLAEDERIAKRAAKKRRAPWQISGRRRVISAAGNPDVAVADTEGLDGEIADHIARHDPDRALREVEGGRRILARYEDCLTRMEDPGYPQAVARDQAREYEDFVLPSLLASWNGHPGCRPEWKMDG